MKLFVYTCGVLCALSALLLENATSASVGWPMPSTTITVKTAQCPGPVDAITTTSNGRTFAFTGSLVYELSESPDVFRAHIMNSAHVFPGLPDEVDAAVTLPSNNKTYVFAGSEYYRYTCDKTGISLDTDYPKDISSWDSDLPSNLDSIYIYRKDGYPRLYATKGNQYWRFRKDYSEIDSGYPKSFGKYWDELPAPVDAAVMKGEQTYFFHGNDFRGRETGENGPVRDVATWWFKCFDITQFKLV